MTNPESPQNNSLHYTVSWDIDIDHLDNPHDAALYALQLLNQTAHDDPGGCNVFTVTDVDSGEKYEVDLGRIHSQP